MAAGRDRTRGIVAAMRAHRHAAPIGLTCGVLIASVLWLGNPFVARPAAAPRTMQPQIRMGAAELSLPEPTAPPAPVFHPPPLPAPVQVAPAAPAPAPAFVVPPAQAPAPPQPPKTRQMGGGKRATIIVETLPAKPIIPPFVPGQPAGATPEPRPPLPLDTEIGGNG